MAASTEKDVVTMPTQKIFKQRVRARMAKTGESYTAARRQLLHKAAGPTADPAADPVAEPAAQQPAGAVPADALGVSDASMVRATGHDHAHWFALLDGWGATEHTHTEIARWLAEAHAVPPWWRQSVTVAYERARGMRARHEMRDGFSVSATKTIDVDAEQALAAFADPRVRGRWLPAAEMRQRPTRAALSARFDWSDPSSRVIVTVVPKGPAKTLVSVGHEQLPDADTGERLKASWRASLNVLKTYLEGKEA